MMKTIFLICFLSISANAQLLPNGSPVCDTSANSGFWTLPGVAPDGAGGVYVCWRDARNGFYDIYAQRIGPDGAALWQRNGIPVVKEAYAQQFQKVISDNRGGAYVAWEDGRSGTNTYIYAQHIDRSGNGLWQTNGVKIAETPGLFISIANDNRGGFLVAWNGPGINNVVVQRIDSAGIRLWGDSGVVVTTRAGSVYPGDVSVISDQMNGAIVAWSQGAYRHEGVYVQRFDSIGNPLWLVNGTAVSDDSNNIHVALASDLNGGGIISWGRSQSLQYCQRVDSRGNFLWPQMGIVLGSVAGGGGQRLTQDGKGAYYVGHSTFVQHIDTSGVILWPGEGVAFTTRSLGITSSSQVRNGTSGMWNFFTYETATSSLDIFAQYIDISGNAHWGSDGKGISVIDGLQDWCAATNVGDGYAIVVWDNVRNKYTSVYAAKVDTSAVITSVQHQGMLMPIGPFLEQNYPNPFNPTTVISYELPTGGKVSLKVYDMLGREVQTLVTERQDAGSHSVTFDGTRFPSGIYLYKLCIGNRLETKKLVLLR